MRKLTVRDLLATLASWEPYSPVAAFGRKAFGTGAFEVTMVTLGVLTIGFGIAALIAETAWGLLVPMVVGLVFLWVLDLVHGADHFASRDTAGHA